MSDDTLSPNTSRPSLPRRALKRLIRTAPLLQDQLTPHLHDLAERLTSQENLELAQELFARAANLSVTLGFQLDPGAALLFQFATWLEEEHSPERVARIVLSDTPLLDGTLLNVLRGSLSGAPLDASPETQASHIISLRSKLLATLCALAALEEQDPSPPTAEQSIDTLLAYFQRAILPHPFHLLGPLAAGHPDAFQELAQHTQTTRDAQRSPLQKTAASLLSQASQKIEAARQERGLIPQHASPSHHQALQFLTLSYLFFIQTYTTRAVIERLPHIILAAKQQSP